MRTDDVAFYSEGLRLAARTDRPDADAEVRGGIAFANGFMTTKDRILPEFAPRLADEGYVVIGFDYRGFGDSEGKRDRLIPAEQVTDVRNAITYLSQLPELSGRPLGVLGASFGGGIATSVAAKDPRVRCHCAIMPVGDGKTWMQELRPNWQYQQFVELVESDHVSHVLTGESKLIDRHEVMIPDPATRTVLEDAVKQYPNVATSLTLDSAKALLEYSPRFDAGLIGGSVPTLFIAAERDVLVPASHAEAMHQARTGPSELIVIPGAGHYELYLDPVVEVVREHVASWFTKWL